MERSRSPMAAAPWVSPPPGPWSHCRIFQAAGDVRYGVRPSSSLPPSDSTNESHGWTTPESQLLMSPKPCCTILPDASRLVRAFASLISSSHVVGGAEIPAAANSFLL